MRILMVASENDGIPRCKAGGIGDVVRDAPRALAALGHDTIVVTPSYGVSQAAPSELIWRSPITFERAAIEIFSVPGKEPNPRVQHCVAHHPTLAKGAGRIYFDDPQEHPFATDATKFANFCRAIAWAVQFRVFGDIDCVHLHDWHAAFFLILRRFHPSFQSLQGIRVVYTIHNLALQGIRPFRRDPSSLEAWYPDLGIDWTTLAVNQEVLAALADPRWAYCVNPMAAGIRLADVVHVVSPHYAEEILRPSDEAAGLFRGEGLEGVLESARAKLVGILNGCDYPEKRVAPAMSKADLLNLMRAQAAQWLSPHLLAYHRLTESKPLKKEPKLLLTCVTRVRPQKLLLLKSRGADGRAGIEGILNYLGGRGLFVLLGSGDSEYEAFFSSISARYDNFVFLNGFSDAVSEALYANGDLFLMPSSFEPCGISQMLAMRDGQPCLAHDVGGLRDTVIDGVNGFVFGGDGLANQVDQLIAAAARAIDTRLSQPEVWKGIQERARAARFLWSESVARYVTQLYRPRP